MAKMKAVATVTAKVMVVSRTTTETVAAVAVTTQWRHDCNGDGWRNGNAMATTATEMAMATMATAMAGMTATTAMPTKGTTATATA